LETARALRDLAVVLNADRAVSNAVKVEAGAFYAAIYNDIAEAETGMADQSFVNRTAMLTAHRACGPAEHDPANGKIHGDCVVCLVPWPCEVAKGADHA